MNVEDLRITKLKNYLFEVIDGITSSEMFPINVNYLAPSRGNCSLDKIPTSTQAQKWIVGIIKRKEVYSFRSRMSYSNESLLNLKNMGFFEAFERTIAHNNKIKLLPNIDGIEKIECLNCGTLNNAESNTAEFDIQIQITYLDKLERELADL